MLRTIELELNIKKGFRKDNQKRRKLLHVSLQHRQCLNAHAGCAEMIFFVYLKFRLFVTYSFPSLLSLCMLPNHTQATSLVYVILFRIWYETS